MARIQHSPNFAKFNANYRANAALELITEKNTYSRPQSPQRWARAIANFASFRSEQWAHGVCWLASATSPEYFLSRASVVDVTIERAPSSLHPRPLFARPIKRNSDAPKVHPVTMNAVCQACSCIRAFAIDLTMTLHSLARKQCL